MKPTIALQLKSIAVCCFVLLYLQPAIAQIDLIPFRSGKLWGVSDSMGKLVIPTKYDDVWMHGEQVNHKPIQLPPGYFICRKDSLYGLLHNEEVLPVEYLNIEAKQNRYLVGTQKKDNELVRLCFNFNGLKLLPDGYFFERLIWIKTESDSYQLMAGQAVFFCVDKQARKSIIVTDFAGSRKPQFLVKDAFALRVKLPQDDRSWVYEVKQEPTDGFTRYEAYFDFERSAVIVSKTAPSTSAQYGGMGNGNGLKGDGDLAIKESAHGDNLRSNNEVSQNAAIYFVKKQSQVFAQYFWNRSDGANVPFRSTMTNIEVPAEAQNLQIISYYNQNGWPEKLKDTQYQFKNFVQYRYNGKTALLYHHLKPVLWLDSLRYVAPQAYGQKKWAGNFLFGNRQDGGQMKYGFMKANGEEIIPPIYDDIVIADPNDRYAKYASGAFWVVYQRNKAGIISPDNQLQLPIAYDSIQFMKGDSQKKQFFLLRQGNQYGAAFVHPFLGHEQPPVLQLIHPFGKDKIVDIHQIGERKKPNSPVILLLLLQNEKGEKLGWRNITGRNYFRY